MPRKVMDNLLTRFQVSHEFTVLRVANRKKENKTLEHQIGTSLFSLSASPKLECLRVEICYMSISYLGLLYTCNLDVYQ